MGDYIRFNSNLKIDSIKINRGAVSSFEDAISSKTQQDSNSIIFNNFADGVVAAHYLDPYDIASGAVFTIYRKTPEQDYYNYICTLDNGKYIFYDYNISNNESYHYLSSVEIPRENNDGFYTYDYQINENTINGEKKYEQAKFDCWSICSIRETDEDNVFEKFGYVWSLGLNYSDENITQNFNVTKQETLGRYDRIIRGEKNSESGSFSGLLGAVKDSVHYKWGTSKDPKTGQITPIKIKNEKYGYTEKKEVYNKYTKQWEIETQTGYQWPNEMEKLKAWKEFCSDGELKLLRDPKGNRWIVYLIDSPSYTIDNISNIKQTTIEFSWEEVHENNFVSVVAFSLI